MQVKTLVCPVEIKNKIKEIYIKIGMKRKSILLSAIAAMAVLLTSCGGKQKPSNKR